MQIEYIEYCQTNEPCVFMSPSWLTMLDSNWQVLKASISTHTIFFVFAYEKKLGFRFIRNSFLTPYSGFHGDYTKMNMKEINFCISAILNQLPKFDILNIDLHPSILFPIEHFSFKTSVKRTNVLSLHSIDENYKNLKPSLQRQIKKAIRNLYIEEEANIENLINLHEKTLAKQNEKLVIPQVVFKKIWNYCQEHHCGKLLSIKGENNAVHASMLMVFDNETVYYLCGGTDENYYGSGAMSGLMWYAIELSIQLEKKYFDFEGSMLSGVNRFFRNFAPTEIQYQNIQKTNSTIFKLLNKK